MKVLDKDNTTCMGLPANVSTETAPYVWMELKTSLFGLDGSTPFTVTLYGQGFSCDNPAGPQVTKVWTRFLSAYQVREVSWELEVRCVKLAGSWKSDV